jgi:hypothetical protein
MSSTLRRKATLVEGRTTTGALSAIDRPRTTRTLEVSGKTSSGSGSVTVKLQGSNDKSGKAGAWVDVATVVRALTTTMQHSRVPVRDAGLFRFYRANVTAISGTGAQGNAYLGT